MARRGHGEGSIYQRNDGRWTAAITLENHKRKTFYGKTRKEVADKLNTALQEQKQGLLISGPSQTVANYLHYWLEKVHKTTIKVSTYALYRRHLDKHIIPALSHIQLQKLTADQVQAFCSEMRARGCHRAPPALHAAGYHGRVGRLFQGDPVGEVTRFAVMAMAVDEPCRTCGEDTVLQKL